MSRYRWSHNMHAARWRESGRQAIELVILWEFTPPKIGTVTKLLVVLLTVSSKTAIKLEWINKLKKHETVQIKHTIGSNNFHQLKEAPRSKYFPGYLSIQTHNLHRLLWLCSFQLKNRTTQEPLASSKDYLLRLIDEFNQKMGNFLNTNFVVISSKDKKCC